MKIINNIITTIYNYQEIDKSFDFFLIKKGTMLKKPSARILDGPVLDGKVLAIQYTSGNSFIVMLKKNSNNKIVIKEIVTKYNAENDNDLSFEQLHIPFEKRYEHSLLQILFNSLASLPPNDGASNIGGKLYYFCKKTNSQIVCIEFQIKKNYIFSLNVKTLTKQDNKSDSKSYVLQSNNTLRLKTEKDKDKIGYSISQYKGEKNEIKFLDTADFEHFNKSKIGILCKIISKFKKHYSKYANIDFSVESDWEHIDVDNAVKNKEKHDKLLKKVFQNKTIRIVDTINDKNSVKLCGILKQQLSLFLENINIVIKDKVGKNDFNIKIIHDKEYYESLHIEDMYKVCSDKIVQHITLEGFNLENNDKLSPNVIVILNELLVKYDLIQSHKVSLYDWNFNKEWRFVLFDKDDFYCMTINYEGFFKIEKLSNDLFNSDEYNEIRVIAEDNKTKNIDEKYRGVVKNNKEEVNIIQETPLFMLPNMERVEDILHKGNIISRSEKERPENFCGCVDIHYFNNKENNCEYYSSGVIGKGMQSSVSHATHIRRVIPYKNNSLFFHEILETMNVSFVRNNQLTVIPFPFKYLREYVEIYGK